MKIILRRVRRDPIRGSMSLRAFSHCWCPALRRDTNKLGVLQRRISPCWHLGVLRIFRPANPPRPNLKRSSSDEQMAPRWWAVAVLCLNNLDNGHIGSHLDHTQPRGLALEE